MRAEVHHINQNHYFYKECDNICFAAKNIYNYSLYNMRQHFFNDDGFLSFKELYHIVKLSDCYVNLPRKVSNQVLRNVSNEYKSFFALNKKKKEGKYDKPVNIPHYKDKEKGRYVATYEKQAISKREFEKNGIIKLSGTNIKIKTKLTNWEAIKDVKISPRANYYVISVSYSPKMESLRADNGIYAAIDTGVNNLATIGFNSLEYDPFIINGRPCKSMNQCYNKTVADLKSKVEKINKEKTSKKIKAVTYKRNKKINDYLHKASHLLVNQIALTDVSKVIIGKNKEWKQDINIGKKNNQNFVMLPIARFCDMLKDKLELLGIEVIYQEESYTSKCSFIDLEPVKKNSKYKGKRKSRGLFRSENGTIINADLNGAYNIMRKAIPNAFAEGTEGFAVSPKLLTPSR